MDQRPPIWVDHRNAVLRRGIVSSLDAAGHRLVGESADLDPLPDVPSRGILVFEAHEPALARAASICRARGVRLVGIAPDRHARRLGPFQRAGCSAVIGVRVLTPELLASAIRAIGAADRTDAGERPKMLVATAPAHRLTDREQDVLRLLAEGSSTRDIAERMNYSERTVKTIVAGVLAKLQGRTRAHAVAIAVRSGMV
jgi:DNA-binding NarL/FixJ family response regulator